MDCEKYKKYTEDHTKRRNSKGKQVIVDGDSGTENHVPNSKCKTKARGKKNHGILNLSNLVLVLNLVFMCLIKAKSLLSYHLIQEQRVLAPRILTVLRNSLAMVLTGPVSASLPGFQSLIKSFAG